MGHLPTMFFRLMVFIILPCATLNQNIRTKRQIQPEQPRILTQNGHMLFQTGTNHNITFRAATGGYININGDNLGTITQMVKDNKQAITQLQSGPTAGPSNVESRLTTVEGRLGNLQPTGQVLTQLNSLDNRLNIIQSTTPQNLGTRLNTVEQGLSNLQPTGQVQSLFTAIQGRLSRVESRTSRSRRTSRTIRRLTSRVQTLETTVTNLQSLLTTNECNSNPCRNGGTCVDTFNGFFCRCTSAFQGSFCDSDINECAVYAGTDMGCQNGATCTNTFGSFTCQCTANWYGVRCTQSHDDCSQASSTELCGQGTCVNNPRVSAGQPRFTCICNDGWTTSGSSPACTTDVNECAATRPPCSVDPLVLCINLPGTFQCGTCPPGYSGNGFTCSDINECAINNGGCSLAPRVDCINTDGSRTCGPCPPGYQGNGITCTWVGICQINNGGCHPLATCQESPGVDGRSCSCPPGYVGNGVGSVGCVSQGPITGPCSSNPCLNGGACQNVGDTSYRCVCQTGYTGQNCQTNIDDCSPNPCQNGGTCTDRVNGYVCQCSDSFSGTNCDDEQQACGGSYNREVGSIRYPAVPGMQYPHGVSCAWRITTTAGKILRLTFPTFSLENHVACAFDFLQIHDGPSASSFMIGKYCGNTPPNGGQLNSTHDQLYLWFKSDLSIASDGFEVHWTTEEPYCGGNLAGIDHGQFSSPGYPGRYPHRRDCVWTISVSPGNMIMFTFATLAIEAHPNCSYDYLEIRDGLLDSAPVLRRYCNSSTPAPLRTTGPTAWVKFHSDNSLDDTGFHITYAAVSAGDQCGGTYTTETGILISPNYPNPYNHRASCVWVITVNERDMLTLTFTNMELENHVSCNYDYVEVRDGPNENAALIGRYCGNDIPSPLTTTQNVLFVKFHSDTSVSAPGFRATWGVACGGTFTDPTGVLRSPYYPDAYPSRRTCEYLITQGDGNRVILTFAAFDVEAGSSTQGCVFDYLEVRDGGSPDSDLIGQYCGATLPPVLETTGGDMYLKFVTDGSVQNTGFEANYEVTEAGCGGMLTEDTDTFESPGHPNVYPHGANCTWIIMVSPGLVVRLTFNAFSMESHSNCAYDSVAVYDNSSANADSLLGRFCGAAIPSVQTSTNNYLTVQLLSDSSLAFEGFTASYVGLNASTLCGTELRDSTGVITSPNYPDPYPHQRECTWTIVAPEGNQILLNITDFSIEAHPNCRYDSLEIRNGGYSGSPLVGVYCGTNVDRIIVSHSNRMYIKFKTDSSVSSQGFRLSFDATASGCGADLTTPTGSFQSPNYPNPYGHNAECFYTIRAASGSTVQLNFVDMNIEVSSTCSYDYVEVRENNQQGQLIGRYCGNSVPDPVTSRSNVVWVKYRTDYSVSGRGFHIFYASICNTRFSSRSGAIESPNFPESYPHNRNCTWIIDTTLGNTLNFSFSHFDIESHTNCQYDHLEIRDGDSATSNALANLCGSNLPAPMATSGQSLWMNFVSDFSVARNGFRMEYVTNGCGGDLNNPTGSFTSPDYPNPYPHRRVCEWVITAATGSYIQLTIEEFDLESHSSCTFDVLEIYGGADSSAPRLAQLCHTATSAQVLTTTGNTMFVRFKSDFSVNGRGFRATYKTNTGGCGGNYSTLTGTLVTKNYPQPYPHNTDCAWLITVATSRTVVLTFTDFDVEGGSDCRYDYVAVFDGPDVNSTELIRHCGNSMPVPSIYRSGSNKMYVHMSSDFSVAGRGFKADYVTGCGGVADAETDGAIVSPNYPETYTRGSNCSWLISAQHSSDRITLIFTHMDIEPSDNCLHDYVRVLDGNDDQAVEVDKFCGSGVPSPITSQGSALYVQFMTDNSVQRTGFRATYSKSTSACGGDYTAASGAFNSPGYPNSYPTNTECVWTVSVSPGSKVQIAFSMFNIENQDNCNSDYVELHEGGLGGPLIGRFCGNVIPSNLTSYNGVWMKFRSDASGTGVGFTANYQISYGGEVTGTSDQIASPQYPANYPHNTNAAWTITVPGGSRIRISFVVLDMELAGCRYDYVRFLDGGSEDSPELNRFCGTVLPDIFISTTNQMRVEFRSDWSSTGQGFLFSWVATSDVPTSPTPPTAGTTPVPGCGGMLNVTDTLQTVVSPGYPDGYRNNLNCTWFLLAPVGFKVWLNITDIDLESHSTCNYDILKIYDFLIAAGPVLGTFCGRVGNENPLTSTGVYATMRFTTDISVNRTGFALQYKTVCGGVIRGDQGVLKSPGYPNNYEANLNCTWVIIVPTGRTIRIEFNDNYNVIGTSGSCAGDYLQLRNGYWPNSPPLGNADGRYCGNSAPTTMETTSYFLNVNFVTDNIGAGAGFSLTYTNVEVSCGGSLTLTDTITMGTVTSPNYPQNYPHNVDCIWVITAPALERIQLDFVEDFSVEAHTECRFDFIEIRDGGTINSNQLAKYCGYTRPSTVYTTGNIMYLRFRTDASVPRLGFKAQYKIATCGGRIVDTSGYLTSPNYPNNYDNNLDCTWIIETTTGHYLTFTFTAFNLPYAGNCSAYDNIMIRDLNSTGPILLPATCGRQMPPPVLTSDSWAQVRFRTDNSGVAPGFSLSFEASVEECGGDRTTPTGSFTSPNFPGRYPHSRFCVWTITVPEGRRVTLTFDPFNLENHGSCRYDYVAVYNGKLLDSTVIDSYCGDNPPSVVETSGNTAKVIFRTDASVTNGGFRATYTSNNEATCGGTQILAPGNITSPGYENGNYSNREECVWTLSNPNPVNSSIVLRFLDLQLETATTCGYDFLDILEGATSSGIRLDRFCGNNTRPPPIITPSPNVYMRFRSDGSIVDKGFNVAYNYTQCGGILTNPFGVVTSPNYPANYDHNDGCAWQITAPEGAQILVHFNNVSIENHPSCRFDYLELFNGPYASSPSIGRFCGNNLPADIRSQGNALRVVFFTDFSLSAPGFMFTYSFTTQGCGGMYHNNFGLLNTPNYPSSYPHNAECVWDLNVAPGYHVSIAFNPPFDMEIQAGCVYDYVEVSDSLPNGTLVSLGRYCQNVLPPILKSSGNRLVVKFRSDATTNGNGFSANWTTECGGLLTGETGLFISPGFPGNYGNNLKCNYTIAGDPEHYVVLSFDENNFNIEAGTNCPYDAVALYRGNDTDGRSLGRFCGSTAPQPVSALGSLYVQFWTDGSLVNTGFRASYRISQCGGVFTSPVNNIRTPTSPDTYHNNQNCTWYITVETDRIVELKFLSFELEAHSSCNYDYLDAYDGPDLNSPLIGRYCGTSVPADFKTTYNTLTLNFVTDSSVVRDGFEAVYRESFGPRQGCGGYLNSTIGQFTSVDANGDGRYENNLNCGWTIIGGNNKVIKLTVQDMQIESALNCHYDYIKVYDGISTDDQLVGTYCGDTPPAEIVSTSNVLFFQFYTDSSVVLAGFNATYTQEDAACGGAYTATTSPQVLTSPGYPNSYPDDLRCRWTIDAANSTLHVHIQVTALNLQNTTACNPEYLEIRDYPLGLQGRSIHACGTVPPPMLDTYGTTAQINYAAVGSSPSTGFSLTYQITTCNRTYTADRGQIFSPNWPGRYPQNINCQMLIQAPAGTTISLYFNTFHIEPHSNCQFDYLEVHNGSTSTAPVISKVCGWIIPDPVFATTNSVWLNFVTDSSVAYPGYDISYTATTQGVGCGGNLQGINGSLTSPGYPGNYTDASTCTWGIQVPARRQVTLTFVDMRMLDPVNCATDYVIVYNGNSDSSPMFGRYCGGEVPALLTTAGNEAFVKFVSDGVGTSIGFRLTFSS